MNEEGNVLRNDEVIFVKEITSDDDTRGGKKFINRHAEIIVSRYRSFH